MPRASSPLPRVKGTAAMLTAGRVVYLDDGAAHETVIELLERTPQAEAAFGGFLKLAESARP